MAAIGKTQRARLCVAVRGVVQVWNTLRAAANRVLERNWVAVPFAPAAGMGRQFVLCFAYSKETRAGRNAGI